MIGTSEVFNLPEQSGQGSVGAKYTKEWYSHSPPLQKYSIGGSKTKSDPLLHITAQTRSEPTFRQARAPFWGAGYRVQLFPAKKQNEFKKYLKPHISSLGSVTFKPAVYPSTSLGCISPSLFPRLTSPHPTKGAKTWRKARNLIQGLTPLVGWGEVRPGHRTTSPGWNTFSAVFGRNGGYLDPHGINNSRRHEIKECLIVLGTSLGTNG